MGTFVTLVIVAVFTLFAYAVKGSKEMASKGAPSASGNGWEQEDSTVSDPSSSYSFGTDEAAASCGNEDFTTTSFSETAASSNTSKQDVGDSHPSLVDDFDLRQAVIYQTILENPYIDER